MPADDTVLDAGAALAAVNSLNGIHQALDSGWGSVVTDAEALISGGWAGLAADGFRDHFQQVRSQVEHLLTDAREIVGPCPGASAVRSALGRPAARGSAAGGPTVAAGIRALGLGPAAVRTAGGFRTTGGGAGIRTLAESVRAAEPAEPAGVTGVTGSARGGGIGPSRVAGGGSAVVGAGPGALTVRIAGAARSPCPVSISTVVT
jgi:uncharacterized protein YukE